MRVVPRVYFELSVPEYICIPGFLSLFYVIGNCDSVNHLNKKRSFLQSGALAPDFLCTAPHMEVCC